MEPGRLEAQVIDVEWFAFAALKFAGRGKSRF
jgi:hypothetical protein